MDWGRSSLGTPPHIYKRAFTVWMAPHGVDPDVTRFSSVFCFWEFDVKFNKKRSRSGHGAG